MSKLLFNKNIVKGNARRETLNGKEHLVLPTIAATVGVMNDALYSEETLQTNIQAWNGVPIPVGHPMVDGKPVSANSPDIQNNSNIGTVYNSRFDDGELKVEFWIDVEKATTLGFGDLVANLESGDTVDVSTGLYSEAEDNAGIFNNKSYSRVISSMVPDHIAILPDEKGACSVADGCGTGAFVANAGDDSGFKPKPCCGGCGEGKPCEGDKKEVKVNAIEKIKNAILEVFSQQDEFVELEDTKKVTQVAVNHKQNMKAEKLIQEIIANSASKFSEGDKEALEALEINVLEGIHGSLPETKKPEVSANSDEIKLKVEEYAQYQEFVANSKKEREGLVVKVKEGFGLDDEQLENLDVNALQKLADKVEGKTDYSAKGGSKDVEVTSNSKSKGAYSMDDIKIED